MTTENSYKQQTKSNEQQAENYKLALCNFGSKTILKVFLQLQQRQVYLKLLSLNSVKQNECPN